VTDKSPSPLDLPIPEPTEAEVRAYRISIGADALRQLRKGMSCPHCGEIHVPQIAALMKLISDGWNALYEAGMASHEALRKEREKNR
jgi:hypothetical protein